MTPIADKGEPIDRGRLLAQSGHPNCTDECLLSNDERDVETGAAIADFHSLIRREESLFPELISLLIRLGTYSRSARGTGVFGVEIACVTPKTGIFPVKFLVCRDGGCDQYCVASVGVAFEPAHSRFCLPTKTTETSENRYRVIPTRRDPTASSMQV